MSDGRNATSQPDRNERPSSVFHVPVSVADLAACDKAASVAHDFIWDKNGVTKRQASDAIWRIHNALRPHLPMDDETRSVVLDEIGRDAATDYIDAAGTGPDLEDTDGLDFNG